MVTVALVILTILIGMTHGGDGTGLAGLIAGIPGVMILSGIPGDQTLDLAGTIGAGDLAGMFHLAGAITGAGAIPGAGTTGHLGAGTVGTTGVGTVGAGTVVIGMDIIMDSTMAFIQA